jgi:hypothetical protein
VSDQNLTSIVPSMAWRGSQLLKSGRKMPAALESFDLASSLHMDLPLWPLDG